MSDELKKLKTKVEAGEIPAFFLHKKRINICNTCPKLIKLTRNCSECLCFVDLKTKILSQSCPIGKW